MGCVSQDSDALVSQGIESRGNRCRKSWHQFKGYDSQSRRYVMRVSGKRKDHRWESEVSKFLISEVPTLWNLRTGPMKWLNDSSDVPEARLGILLKTYTRSKKMTRLHSTFPVRNAYSRLGHQKSPRKESLKLIQERACRCSTRKTLTLLSWRPWGHRRVWRRWWRPTAWCKPEKKRRYTSSNWTHSSKLCFLKKLPRFLLWGTFVRIMGIHNITLDQRSETTSHQKWQTIDCNISNCVPFVVPGLSTSSSTTPTPTSSKSSSQDSVIDGSTSGELRGNPLHETETKNINNKGKQKHKEIFRMNCLVGYRNSGRSWSMKVLQQSFGETQSKEVRTLPSHLMNFQWSREQKWNRVRVSSVFRRTFRRTQIVICAWRRK